MNCYKCGTDKDLSAKSYHSSGHVTFICRSCRRKEHKGRNTYKKKSLIKEEQEWRKFAREKNGALAKKYAQINRRII